MLAKKLLTAALNRIQRSLCTYDQFPYRSAATGMDLPEDEQPEPAPSACDCKYGANRLQLGKSEQGNGCPEMRDAVGILNEMTGREYQMIARRIVTKQRQKVRAMEVRAAKRKK